LTIVTIIQTAKVLYPPFKEEFFKLCCFLPLPVLSASFIGINFLHELTTLAELTLIVAIITMPVALLFQYRDSKIRTRKAIAYEQQKNSESYKALQANKLLLLQAQINPHFLFNTLENIKQYITSDPEKAQHLLMDYTFFLRQSLPTTETSQGTINSELELINAYIAIQQTRFPYIRYIEQVNEQIKVQPLPPLLIQPLIENSIVHGLAPHGHQGLIELTIKSELGNLIIEVDDNGIGFDEKMASDKSIALKNIKSRLEIYHPQSSITILEPPQGATVQIIIPLKQIS
ncbi:MAG: hypothetical protein GY951_04795, partial [Psychromonas sp.]|nr:hypothetical protein [Psychromonas sp.]